MSFKKFEATDIFQNTIKTKPRFEFKIYNGKISLNTLVGYTYLNNLNLPSVEGCLLPYSFDFSCPENSYNVGLI